MVVVYINIYIYDISIIYIYIYRYSFIIDIASNRLSQLSICHALSMPLTAFSNMSCDAE